jgi:hypothetical protein
MPDPLIEHDDAATPLTPAERAGLIPAYITHRHELNEAEQTGVLTADRWVFERRRQILDEPVNRLAKLTLDRRPMLTPLS